MVSQKLRDYIQQQRQLGISKAQIRKDLLANGWTESDIDPVLVDDNAQPEGQRPTERKKLRARKVVLLLIILGIAYAIFSGVMFVKKAKEKMDSGEVWWPRSDAQIAEEWANASPEEKTKSEERTEKLMSYMKQEWIDRALKDGTKQALELPFFWNGPVRPSTFICQKTLPDDFFTRVQSSKATTDQNNEVLERLRQQYPGCIDEKYIFNYKNNQCEPAREQYDLHFHLSVQASAEGRRLIETYCERIPFD